MSVDCLQIILLACDFDDNHSETKQELFFRKMTKKSFDNMRNDLAYEKQQQNNFISSLEK